MKTIYNPHTMATYILNKDGSIRDTINKKHTTCTMCDETKQLVQNGIYAGLCQRCRRKQYYLNNKEKENAKCREYYRDQSGRERMLERRYGGNYKKRLDKDGNKCTTCGSSKDLTIHHIDETGMKTVGSYKKSNNSIENLITLCRSCHSKIHNSS